MLRKKIVLSLLTLFLLTGAALAENHTATNDTASDDHADGDAMTDDERECYDEYQDDLADEKDSAESDYRDCLDDAERDHENDHESDDAHDEDERDESEEDEEDDSEHLPVPDDYTGEHVYFRVTESGIADYTVEDQLIFSDAYVGFPADWDDFKVEGASLELEGVDDVEVKISDAPTGVFRFEADDDALITIEFPEGYSIREAMRDSRMDDRMGDRMDDNESDDDHMERERDHERYEDRSGHGHNHLILTGPDNLTAHVYVEDGYSYDNGTLITPEEIRLVVAGGPGLRERHHERTLEGIANGRIAAEVEVPRNGRAIDAEFGDVNVTLESTDSGLIAHVDRNDPEGRTILFSLEEGALGDLGALQVLFDGEPIGLADDAEDVMDTSDGVAEYLILIGGEGAEVLVQVPHFSPHTIELQGNISSAAIPGPSVGLVAIGVLGLAAAVQSVRRH